MRCESATRGAQWTRACGGRAAAWMSRLQWLGITGTTGVQVVSWGAGNLGRGVDAHVGCLR
jgi:hypothetical protein